MSTASPFIIRFLKHEMHKTHVSTYQVWDILSTPVMNIDFVLTFQTGFHGHVRAHKLICSHTCALLRQKEYDYVVHFVHRHRLDRCICGANLDGFSDWILNQNSIFLVPPCCRLLHAYHTCCFPLKSFIDKMVMERFMAFANLAEWWTCEECEPNILANMYASCQRRWGGAKSISHCSLSSCLIDNLYKRLIFWCLYFLSCLDLFLCLFYFTLHIQRSLPYCFFPLAVPLPEW